MNLDTARRPRPRPFGGRDLNVRFGCVEPVAGHVGESFGSRFGGGSGDQYPRARQGGKVGAVLRLGFTLPGVAEVYGQGGQAQKAGQAEGHDDENGTPLAVPVEGSGGPE